MTNPFQTPAFEADVIRRFNSITKIKDTDMSNIYLVTGSGDDKLVNAKTAQGAIRFVRNQIAVKAVKASQPDLVRMVKGGVAVEDATAEPDDGAAI